MIIFKIFPHLHDLIKFKNNLLSITDSFKNKSLHSSGIYSRITKHTVTILNVDNDPSLRGGNFNISFYGIVFPWFSKKILLGWIGPSIIYTLLTLLIVLIPFEYIEFRIISIAVWFIVYLTNTNKIKHLKELITRAIDSKY